MKLSCWSTTRLSARLALLAVGLLSFSACGMQSDNSGARSTPGMPQTIDGPKVEIVAFKFTPEIQTVARGTTVSWVNRDPYYHTITSGKTDGPVNEPDGVFDRDLKERDDVVQVKFERPGTYTYFCKQHNAMNAEIQVS
jgi:plastocyanin